jgi:hypothetical protein
VRQLSTHPLGALEERNNMNLKNLCIVILRVLGIFCLIQSFALMQNLSFAFSMSQETPDNQYKIIIAAFLPSIILLTAGILLLVFSTRLSGMIVPGLNDDKSRINWSLKDIQSILFSVVGVYIFCNSIQHLFGWISQLINVISGSAPLSYKKEMTISTWISISLNLLQTLTGIGLFFGARGLSGIWHQIREWSPNKNISKRT